MASLHGEHFRVFVGLSIGALVVGWLGERVQKMRYATSVLLLLLGQGIGCAGIDVVPQHCAR